MPEEEKRIGEYVMKMNSEFDESGDFIVLSLSISDELKDLLRECVINEVAEGGVYDGSSRHSITRYKVRRPLYSLMSGDNRDILFEKNFLDTGKVTLQLRTVSWIDTVISEMRSNLKNLVDGLNRVKNSNVTITLNLS